MKIKLWCKLFGHDFTGNDGEWKYASEYCRKCGLTKKEVLEFEK